MTATRKRAFSARLESLESRECLSTTVATPHHLFIPITAFGTAQVTSLTSLVGGGFAATGVGAANVSKLGHVTATMAGFFSQNLLNAAGSGVMTDAAGEQLDFTVSGIFHATTATSTITTGYFHFVITGGTGQFAHATGSGSIIARANFATLGMTFTATGTLIE